MATSISGTLGGKQHWIVRNKLVLSIGFGAFLLVLVVVMIVLTLQANAAADRATRELKDMRYGIMTDLHKFSDETTKLEVTSSIAGDTLENSIRKLETDLGRIAIPAPTGMPLAALYSTNYKTALGRSNETASQVSSLRQSLVSLREFTAYNTRVAKVFEQEKLKKAITSEDSAKNCVTAWTSAQNDLAKFTVTGNLAELNGKFVAGAKGVAAYCQILADAYKKNDQTILKNAAPELDKRYEAIRKISDDVESAAANLNTRLQQDILNLSS
jgi:hypothetical protein